jgi:tetratricopeptide (TPR) repeat protein
MTVRSLLRLSPVALALALAACAQGPKKPVPVSAAPVIVTIDTAMALLDRGDEAGARKEVRELLKRNPNDPEARVLQDSLDRDPAELLGPKNFDYLVQPGDTMIGLSEKFLGTKLKFYQLARYNGVKVPAALAAGTTIKIPGEAPRPVETPRTRPSRSAEPAPKASKPKAAPAPTAPARSPAAAQKARSAGLAALNQGKVAQAVALLRRAAVLDPGNPLIQRDLSRAERIERTVQARH